MLKIDYKLYFPAVLSGALMIFAFPPYGLWWLAFFALVPFLSSLWNLSRWQAIKSGFVFGLVYFFGTQYWIYHSISNYGGMNIYLALATVFLLAMYLSLYTSLFALLFARNISTSSLPALFLAPLFWVVLEYLRGIMFTGFPWSSIGYTQYTTIHLIQIADITGMYGVSFLVMAINGAIADYFISRNRRVDMPLFTLAPTVLGYIVLAILITVTLGYGKYRLNENRIGKSIKVSVIQGNIEQDIKWLPSYQSGVINTYKRLSRQAKEQKPDLIVWPETSMPFFFNHNKIRQQELLDFQLTQNIPLVLGAMNIVKTEDGNRLSNTAILLNQLGELQHTYDKIHLVPFGEYVPLSNIFFFVKKLVTGIGVYVPGDNMDRAKIKVGEFATLICYEIIFPDLVRKAFKDGGDFMVTITNDAWFGTTPGPYQHFSMAVFRAIENRKPVIRAANTGISGFIDSNGSILSSTKLFERKVLTQSIYTDPTITFYNKYGDILIYFCTIILIVLLIDFRRK